MEQNAMFQMSKCHKFTAEYEAG